jgi:hypothetical protein
LQPAFPIEGVSCKEVHMPRAPRDDQQAYPAEKARQGEIILRTPLQRIVFIGGLAGMLLVGILALFIR